MINYELKSKLINSEILKVYKKWSLANYQFAYCEDKIILEELRKINEHANYFSKNFPVEWKECGRISRSSYARTKRLKDRITSILNSGDCLFLTLTFTDKVLSETSSATRKAYVKRFLCSLDCTYVANIDYGKRNGREHYHAVVGIDNIDYHLWSYGAINGLKIRNDTDDITRISKYVSKLTNHAIKKTTKRNAIIYSRKFKFYE